MTFETTTHFLTEAAINQDSDTLATPSSSIIIGKPPRTGTGAFEVRSSGAPTLARTPAAGTTAGSAATPAKASAAANEMQKGKGKHKLSNGEKAAKA